MHKLLKAAIAAIALSISFVNCNAQSIPKIIAVQDKPQEWADALKLGFDDGLRDAGYENGKNVFVIPRSAAGDPQGLTSLAQAAVQQRPAAIFALGTQAAQAVFHDTKTENIIFGAVTDPVQAGLYDGSLDKPLGNITGTQDLWPYPAQFDLIMELVPKAKKIGILYNAAEINSQVSVQHIRAECQKRHLQLLERAITDESQITAAVNGLIQSGADALFIPADNTVQTSARTVIAAANIAHIPVFTGISGIVEFGAIGTVGTNYYQLGKVNGAQAAKILGGAAARTIPVQTADKGDLYLNAAAANKLGITIPKQLLAQAFKVYGQ
jgi:putative tryptophan/tyrosine transport system substrate-binding protein